jgi:hypothetical protein
MATSQRKGMRMPVANPIFTMRLAFTAYRRHDLWLHARGQTQKEISSRY